MQRCSRCELCTSVGSHTGELQIGISILWSNSIAVVSLKDKNNLFYQRIDEKMWTKSKGEGAMSKGEGAMSKGEGVMSKGEGAMSKGEGAMSKISINQCV